MSIASLEGPLVEVDTLACHLGDANLVILDATVDLPLPRFDGDHAVRSGLAGWRAGHIPTSRHADLIACLSDPGAETTFRHLAPEAAGRAFEALGVGDGSRVVLYDRGGGVWATRVWWLLRAIGKAASVLDGGWAAWRSAGLPIAVAEAPAPVAAGRLTVRRRDAWVELEEVERIARGEAAGTLICALSRAAFAGATPTRYSRRGHIPASRVLPARELVDAEGRFLPLGEAGAIVKMALEGANDRIVLYCGGGISATGTAFVLERLGYANLAVYDESLEEWTADPSRPVVLA